MKGIVMRVAFSCTVLFCGGVAASPGPTGTAPVTAISSAKDIPYPGEISLAVDATDVDRRIVHVHETMSGVNPRTVLFYPKWLPGEHAPGGTIERVAGLRISAQGAPLEWTRDPADVFAFRVSVPARIRTIDIDFDYLSPTSRKIGEIEFSPNLLLLEWNSLVMYPAGYFARRIPVRASVTLPDDWKFGSALDVAETSGPLTTFKPASLEVLIDSPVYAGRYSSRVDLDPGAAVPVHLDIFADHPDLLAMTPEQTAAHRSLVQQAYKLFGAPHYAHYDFLYSLSDQIRFNGLEHHQSSEDGTDPEALEEWAKTAYTRDLLPHEFTHSWNGKFRRPADLWTPNYNVAMQGSLLTVYEGQTQYWGAVLAARSGLWTKQQALDSLAQAAAYYDTESGRHWRNLEDTTNDPVINPRHPMPWRDWQRFEDYYQQGQLVWLEIDTLLRERTAGKRSLDDFARVFFGIDGGGADTVTYRFDDVVRTLTRIAPYGWAALLRKRFDAVDEQPPLEGLRRGGYRLNYTDVPSEFWQSSDQHRKRTGLLFSIGVEIDDKDATILRVMWGSAAYGAKLTEGTQIVAVNGTPYAASVLKEAIQTAKTSKDPINLILKTGERFRVVALEYHGGLRYPHLERDPSVPARLDDILAPR